MRSGNIGAWPKVRGQLSEEQVAVMEDWQSHFLSEILPRRFGIISRFNHKYALRYAHLGGRVLEIGAGQGQHLEYETLENVEEYVAVDIRTRFVDMIERRYPGVRAIAADCQDGVPFSDGHFDRVIAIHVLEHLERLPDALSEVRRVLKADGVFSMVIPCEGGKLYSFGRRLTVQRQFERRYGVPYEWMINYDHVNTAREIVAEVRRMFRIRSMECFPTRIPSIDLNLLIGLTACPWG